MTLEMEEIKHDVRVIDMTGQQFGRLTVLQFSHSVKHNAHWKCLCECGSITTTARSSLVRGFVKSCGCYITDWNKATKTIHGSCSSDTYGIWRGMLTRCYNKKAKDYKYYGGRGILVCKEWHNFKNFLTDMGHRPNKTLSIDRIDNNKGYSPDNCRWATRSEQQCNKSNSRRQNEQRNCRDRKDIS